MKRKIIMGVLALGAIAGFGSAFHHMRGGRHHRAERAAAVCVDAALAEAEGTLGDRPPRVHRMERRVAELCADEARKLRPAA